VPDLDCIELDETKIMIGASVQMTFPPNNQELEEIKIVLTKVDLGQCDGKWEILASFSAFILCAGKTYKGKFERPEGCEVSTNDIPNLEGINVRLFSVKEIDIFDKYIIIGEVSDQNHKDAEI
jgi:hypothetical protein